MGRIGSISHGTPEERAVYARALGQVLDGGQHKREVQRLNRESWFTRLVDRIVGAGR